MTTGDAVQAAAGLLLHSVLGRPLLPVAPHAMAVMVQLPAPKDYFGNAGELCSSGLWVSCGPLCCLAGCVVWLPCSRTLAWPSLQGGVAVCAAHRSHHVRDLVHCTLFSQPLHHSTPIPPQSTCYV